MMVFHSDEPDGIPTRQKHHPKKKQLQILVIVDAETTIEEGNPTEQWKQPWLFRFI